MQGRYGVAEGEERICLECLTGYRPTQERQKFCSSSCRQRAHQRQRVVGRADGDRFVRLAEALLERLEAIERRLPPVSSESVVVISDMRGMIEEIREQGDTIEEEAA